MRNKMGEYSNGVAATTGPQDGMTGNALTVRDAAVNTPDETVDCTEIVPAAEPEPEPEIVMPEHVVAAAKHLWSALEALFAPYTDATVVVQTTEDSAVTPGAPPATPELPRAPANEATSAAPLLVDYKGAAHLLATSVSALRKRVHRGDNKLVACMVTTGRRVRFSVAKLTEKFSGRRS
jgi:hypothetical protein